MIAAGWTSFNCAPRSNPSAEITELAAWLHPMTAAPQVPLIINDHAAIAREVGAEGVHRWAGRRVRRGRAAARGGQMFCRPIDPQPGAGEAALAGGADYIGLGPLFATPTKPDYLPIGFGANRGRARRVSMPIFCIGGIKLENLAQVIAAGARRVVIVSGLAASRGYRRVCALREGAPPAESEIRNPK